MLVGTVRGVCAGGNSEGVCVNVGTVRGVWVGTVRGCCVGGNSEG